MYHIITIDSVLLTSVVLVVSDYFSLLILVLGLNIIAILVMDLVSCNTLS